MSPEMQMIVDTLDTATADFIFGAVMLLIFAAAITVVLFASLAIRALYRLGCWLAVHTWRDAIIDVERKALGRPYLRAQR